MEKKDFTLTAKSRVFLDASGREVILHGINLVCKNPESGYLFPCGEELFQDFQRQGLNLIRFGLLWDGVEPAPGVYDDNYLARAKEQIRWAEKYGIYVFLDMHQDLYSADFGDGAPDWATVTQHKYQATPLWSQAYYSDAAVNQAFDGFWNNILAADGVGLVEHYQKMWVHVTNYFSDCRNIFGLDVLNEPYLGSKATEAFWAVLNRTLEEVGCTQQEDIMKLADEPAYFRQFQSRLQDAIAPVEQEVLQPFYRSMCEALRDSGKQILLETNYFGNLGLTGGLDFSKIAGEQTTLIYSPHIYDLAVDTDQYSAYSNERVALLYAAHRAFQLSCDVPVILGEWGAFPPQDFSEKAVKENLSLIEKYLWSHTYWCWYPGFDQSQAAAALDHAYPQAVCGRLLSYGNSDGGFFMEWIPGAGVTQLYYPGASQIKEQDILWEGAPASSCSVDYSRSGENLILLHTKPAEAPWHLFIKPSDERTMNEKASS